MIFSPLYHIIRPTKRNIGTFSGKSKSFVTSRTRLSSTLPFGKSTPFGMTR